MHKQPRKHFLISVPEPFNKFDPRLPQMIGAEGGRHYHMARLAEGIILHGGYEIYQHLAYLRRRVIRNKCLALIDCFHGVVDAFHIVALVGEEGAFLQRDRLIRGREDLSSDGGIGDVARCGQLVEQQPGNAVHQHMAFVAPVELIPSLIVLVGGRVDTEGAVRVAFRAVSLGEFVFCISPIRRQRLHDIETAVMGNEPVVV